MLYAKLISPVSRIIIRFTNLYLTYFIIFTEYIGYSAFKNRNKLARWYDLVQEELGDYYKEVNGEFSAKLKLASGQQHQQGEVQAHAVKQ